ncbi:hypothetical protein [Tenacibaculum mesophilum]|uniref:hypothetical protein n=1 Tax=Tenacibaculum mesophilum TaxID=104268 RepID=UPI0024918DEF|nr:hypothetical protein [Tenacibaculum mesophilum]
MKPLIFFLLVISFSCSNKNENKATDDALTFGDFVELEKLNKVEMSNNSGTFNLSDKQIEKIREELSQMVYEPNVSVKVGAINMELTVDGKTYRISSATHGDYIEVHRDIVTKNKSSIVTSDWLYFKTGKANFDNYKNENQ